MLNQSLGGGRKTKLHALGLALSRVARRR
jgi:hypothetical protein